MQPTTDLATIYIVRHGQTEWNTLGKLQGHADSPLTLLGEQQARDLGNLLKNIHFDAVYSSDLLRARRTAELIVLERQLEVMTSQAIRERSFGKYEGSLASDFDKKFEHVYAKMETLSLQERFKTKFEEDIESDDEMITRFITFLREIAVAYPNKTILMVSHGALIRAFLIHLGYGTYESLGFKSVGNTSYIKIRTDGTDFFLDATFGIVTDA